MSSITRRDNNESIVVQVQVREWNDDLAWTSLHDWTRDGDLYGYYDDHQGEYLKVPEERVIDMAEAKAVDLQQTYVNVRVARIKTTVETSTEVL